VLEEVSLASAVGLIEVVKIRGCVDGWEEVAGEGYSLAIGQGHVAVAAHVLAAVRRDDKLDSCEVGVVFQ